MRIRRAGKGAGPAVPTNTIEKTIKMVGTLCFAHPTTLPVIASAAKQSILAQKRKNGLLRRKRSSAMTRLPGQFLVLSTNVPFLIHGIMSAELAPTSSIGCWSSARVALNEVWFYLVLQHPVAGELAGLDVGDNAFFTIRNLTK